MIIITQAPVESTVADFDQMIKQEKVQCVVMLCNILEGNKVRCYDYIDGKDKKMLEEYEDSVEISEVTIDDGE
jgi:protein tyrosine phosphatase